MAAVERVVLIGFSGTGKSSVARQLAARLGWAVADTDADIEATWGRSIPAIFREQGEAAFRASERGALLSALARDEVVVATGGGAVVEDAVWARDGLYRPGTLVVALDARPETMLARLRAQAATEGDAVERPMLAGADPLGRIAQLKRERQACYDRADITLVVDRVGPAAVVDDIAAVVGSRNGEALRIELDAASGRSSIAVQPGALAAIGAAVRTEWPQARNVWIISDANVGPLHGPTAQRSLRDAGFAVHTQVVASGEGSKSLAVASELYDWLLGAGIERGDVVVALGGGVVGDLAGFVAATVLRGVGLVQAPTSLLAAVDSSVGGKTGINHEAGKNLIGAFLQPNLVIVDTELLGTMPARELRSGWGEVVKHAIIQASTPGGERGDLWAFLERNVMHLKCLDEPATSYAIWRNIGLKGAVVAADERERGGRALLNFGHTLGHAIEASDYCLLHGEAVAVGMCAAAKLGVLAETCGEAEADRIIKLVAAFDLPREADVETERVLALLKSDKKRVAGKHRFILPCAGGGVTICDDVPVSAVVEALASVTRVRASA